MSQKRRAGGFKGEHQFLDISRTFKFATSHLRQR